MRKGSMNQIPLFIFIILLFFIIAIFYVVALTLQTQMEKFDFNNTFVNQTEESIETITSNFVPFDWMAMTLIFFYLVANFYYSSRIQENPIGFFIIFIIMIFSTIGFGMMKDNIPLLLDIDIQDGLPIWVWVINSIPILNLILFIIDIFVIIITSRRKA